MLKRIRDNGTLAGIFVSGGRRQGSVGPILSLDPWNGWLPPDLHGFSKCCFLSGSCKKGEWVTGLEEVAGCVEVGLVKRVHTLFLRNAQQVVYELQVREEVEGVRQEVRDVKGEIKVEGESLTS